MEIRTYAPRLVADATVQTSDPSKGRNSAFRLLFDYISGKNKSAESISMTVPVEAAKGEKIAMTVPVQTAEADTTMSMRFFFPAKYTLETAPQPLDPRVKIMELPQETVAVRTYSGSTSDDRLRKEQDSLFTALGNSGWQAAGDPSALFYDPPWTLWFARRNEAVIPVKRM